MSPVVQTLAELVAIDSVNPEWGGPGEAAVAVHLCRFFERHGIETVRNPVLPGRDNVVIRIPGQDRSRSLLFECHMDTVGVEGMAIPAFEPVIDGGRLFGRGACDVKAGLAAIMHAFVEIHRGSKPPCVDLILAAVVDEEHQFRGVTSLLGRLEGRPSGAVVAEPTGLRVARANKGVLRWRIIARGRSAHSSRPELGVDAITAMAEFIQAVRDENGRLHGKAHPLVGSPTCNIGLIEGGEQINFVPAHCVISLDRRLVPGESIEAVLGGYRQMLAEIESRWPGLTLEMEDPLLADAPMETPVDATIVRAAAMIAGGIGMDPDPIGVPFGCDCTKLSRAGIPSVIFGPGSIEQAHTADEWVSIGEVEKAVDFYRELALHYRPS